MHIQLFPVAASQGLLLSKCDECANTLMGLVATRAAAMCKAISEDFSGMCGPSSFGTFLIWHGRLRQSSAPPS